MFQLFVKLLDQARNKGGRPALLSRPDGSGGPAYGTNFCPGVITPVPGQGSKRVQGRQQARPIVQERGANRSEQPQGRQDDGGAVGVADQVPVLVDPAD